MSSLSTATAAYLLRLRESDPKTAKNSQTPLQVLNNDDCKITSCGDAICWPSLYKGCLTMTNPCEKLHFPSMTCPVTLSFILQQRPKACQDRNCEKYHFSDIDDVLGPVMKWYGPNFSIYVPKQEKEEEPAVKKEIVLCQPISLSLTPVIPPPLPEQPASLSSSSNETNLISLSQFQTRHFWQALVNEKHPDNTHLQSLVSHPSFQSMLSSPGSLKLWSGRRSTVLKELSESYAVLTHVMNRLPSYSTGSELTLIDVCSGKGITALMAAHLLPNAKVVMVDSDEQMRLDHLNSLLISGSVEFYRLDIFTDNFFNLLESKNKQFQNRRIMLLGTHLCGALSPRLISLFDQLRFIDYLVLVPCCLKGWLGKTVKARALELRKETSSAISEDTEGNKKVGKGNNNDKVKWNYKVLCNELVNMFGNEGTTTAIVYDEESLSPKNGYITSGR